MFATMILTLAMTGQSPRNEIADLMTAPAPTRRVAPRYSAQSRGRTAGYRAHNAQVQREVMAMQAQQAAIMAEQARQYRADLPFMLELRRQDLNRQSDFERNAILNRYLNGTSYVPPVNLTPGPVDNGNRLPTP